MADDKEELIYVATYKHWMGGGMRMANEMHTYRARDFMQALKMACKGEGQRDELIGLVRQEGGDYE